MFSTPTIALWDVTRIVAALLAVAVVVMVPFSVTVDRRMTWDQQARMAGEWGMCVAVVGAYLYQLGTVPEQWWRNVLVLLAVAAFAAGHARFLLRYWLARRARRRVRRW